MRSLIESESGIAWGLVVVFVMMVGGAALYILFSPVANDLVKVVNLPHIQESASTRTGTVAAFGVDVWKFIPIITLFGLFAWIVSRAHERGEE